ncbi:hypothetical protein JW906_03430 [bacterium]|nr:hypothetical protein [bacterium]
MKEENQEDIIGRLVLIHYQDRPTLYARCEAVEPDVKKGWYHLTLLLLTIPAKTVTWILKEEYILGAAFTMGGQAMRLEGVPPHRPEKEVEKGTEEPGSKGGRAHNKVIPFRRES